VSAGPVIVNVAGEVEFDKGTQFVVIGGDAGDVLFQIAGDKVTFGKDSTVIGTFFAPNAKIKLEKNSVLVGALYGEKLDIKKEVEITYELAIEALVAAAVR
jgi:choice-of-anchor A domain-containing protein